MKIKILLPVVFVLFNLNIFSQNGKIVYRQEINLKADRKLKKEICSKKDHELKPEYRYLDSVKVEKIRYMSDGLEVVGYICSPIKSGKYPAIIYNRGGNREFAKINSLKLAKVLSRMASWGYVVIGSQYRGNDGGEGKEEFGGKDVDDVLNLIPLLKNQPNVDPEHLGIYGRSRGGMMTYLTLMRTSEFKAAVVVGGLSDLQMMIDTRPGMESVYKKLIPDYAENKQEAIDKRSAINNVDRICKKTPILLMHGTADWRVVPLMSLEMATEFNENRIPYRLIMFEGGDHSITEHKDEVNQQLRSWFDRFLKQDEKLPELKPHGA